MQKTHTKRNPQCPRCGYDLRGAMSMWEETCPLMGKCSECGLDFEWAIVCDPWKYEPLWCVEFSPGWKSILKSSFKTFGSSFVPWYFWTRINMSHEVRKRRLFAYLTCFILPLLLSYVLVQSGVAVYVLYKSQNEMNTYVTNLPIEIKSLKDSMKAINSGVDLEHIPLVDREEAKKQYLENMQQSLDYLSKMQANPPVLHHSYNEAVYEALFYPTSWNSAGYYLYHNDGIYSYYSPSELHLIVLNDIAEILSPYFTEMYIWYYMVIPVAITGIVGTGLLIVFPFSFVLLPQSRKRAKVQWRHIARISVYSVFIPFASILFFILLYIVGALAIFAGISENLIASVVVGGGMSIWLMLIIWWAVAIKRYLKMPHGFAIAVLLCILNMLVMSMVVVLLTGAFTPSFWV